MDNIEEHGIAQRDQTHGNHFKDTLDVDIQWLERYTTVLFLFF